MATIEQYINSIKSAVYGKDVRGAIYEALSKLHKNVSDLKDSEETINSSIEDIRDQIENISTGSGSSSPTIVDSMLSDTSTRPVQNKVIKKAIDNKANKHTTYGGFEGGENADAYYGAAVGQNAQAGMGAAAGAESEADEGGAVGYSAVTTQGGAVGGCAVSDTGGAIGAGAHARFGGAIGQHSLTSDGFAGGNLAITGVEYTENGETKYSPIDAIQLGEGTNQNEHTMQVYDTPLLDENGKLYPEVFPSGYGAGSTVYKRTKKRSVFEGGNFINQNPIFYKTDKSGRGLFYLLKFPTNINKLHICIPGLNEEDYSAENLGAIQLCYFSENAQEVIEEYTINWTDGETYYDASVNNYVTSIKFDLIGLRDMDPDINGVILRLKHNPLLGVITGATYDYTNTVIISDGNIRGSFIDEIDGLAVDNLNIRSLADNYAREEIVKLKNTGGVSSDPNASATEIDSIITESSSNPVRSSAIYAALNSKVTAEVGKGLSTNDFTDHYKTKLDDFGESNGKLTYKGSAVGGSTSNSSIAAMPVVEDITNDFFVGDDNIINPEEANTSGFMFKVYKYGKLIKVYSIISQPAVLLEIDEYISNNTMTDNICFVPFGIINDKYLPLTPLGMASLAKTRQSDTANIGVYDYIENVNILKNFDTDEIALGVYIEHLMIGYKFRNITFEFSYFCN